MQYISSSNVVGHRNNQKIILKKHTRLGITTRACQYCRGCYCSYDIPHLTESYGGYNGEGDQPYTTLEGGDVYPEVFIGRI